jgi:prepilin-type N-terminal cleavage/methylation domain-containing protein
MKKPVQNQLNQRGFSLIELLVVATVIIVLTAIGLVSYSSAGKGARDGKRKADIETVRQAMVLMRAETGSYPTGSFENTVSLLGSGGFLSQPYPKDPKDVSPHTYTRTTPSGMQFCLCARLERDGTGNSGGTSCTFTAATKHFFCVANP